MDHDTLTTLPCCEASWQLDQHELDAAHDDGMPAYVLEGICHSCCLEPIHDGPCTCQCGASR